MLAGVKITVYFRRASNYREGFDLGDKAGLIRNEPGAVELGCQRAGAESGGDVVNERRTPGVAWPGRVMHPDQGMSAPVAGSSIGVCGFHTFDPEGVSV